MENRAVLFKGEYSTPDQLEALILAAEAAGIGHWLVRKLCDLPTGKEVRVTLIVSAGETAKS